MATDVNGSSVVQWGETAEDVAYTGEALDQVVAAGERAAIAGEYAAEHAAFVDALRGAATMLGFVVPLEEDVAVELRAHLIASRDHEGETSERIIQAANGLDEDTRRAARVKAMAFSGRRGALDSAAYWIDRGLAGLRTIREYEAKAAAAR